MHDSADGVTDDSDVVTRRRVSRWPHGRQRCRRREARISRWRRGRQRCRRREARDSRWRRGRQRYRRRDAESADGLTDDSDVVDARHETTGGVADDSDVVDATQSQQMASRRGASHQVASRTTVMSSTRRTVSRWPHGRQ